MCRNETTNENLKKSYKKLGNPFAILRKASLITSGIFLEETSEIGTLSKLSKEAKIIYNRLKDNQSKEEIRCQECSEDNPLAPTMYHKASKEL